MNIIRTLQLLVFGLLLSLNSLFLQAAEELEYRFAPMAACGRRIQKIIACNTSAAAGNSWSK